MTKQPPEPIESDRQAGAIEVTPAMIEAGADILWQWLGDGVSQSEPRVCLEDITRSILAAALHAQTST